MVTVSVRNQSPVAAKRWTDCLVNAINEHMRAQDVEEAEASINYLQEKLNETKIAGMQHVFYQLIESESRAVMHCECPEGIRISNSEPGGGIPGKK